MNWEEEGEILFQKLQMQSLTFALGFAIGKWWASMPKDVDEKSNLIAKQVAEAEREACAQICEEILEFPAGHGGMWEGYGPVKTTRLSEECAKLIRARGKV